MTLDVRPVGVIPARANSSRFPNKILAEIQGKPMVQWVWEAACRAKRLSSVVVATDSKAIADCVKSFGGAFVMTEGEFTSGTDRVAHVSRERGALLVVNIQGDEPLISPDSIDRLVAVFDDHPSADMATLAVRISDPIQLQNKNVVKVVTSKSGQALYFSRHPLAIDSNGDFLKHIGIYAYRKQTLERLSSLPPSPLEITERLEQLRALENGYKIWVVEIDEDTIAVDEPGDVAKVAARLSKA